MNDVDAAEELPLRWNRTYSDATYNGAASVVEDGDEYVVLGQSGAQASGIPGWLFGTDATSGEGSWTATVASEDRRPPTFQTHLPAVDGDGYALLGVRAQAGTASLVRTDADGAVQWRETYEGNSDGDANASILARDAVAIGDGYLIAGTRAGGQGAGSSGLVVRVGPDGEERSRTRLFPDQRSEILSVVPDGDGYAGAAAVRSSSGGGPTVRAVLFRADADDELQWREAFTAPTDGDPFVRNQLVDLAADGDGYVAAGYTSNTSVETVDGWVLSVDGSGNQRASRRLSPRPVTLFTGVATTDDGVVVAGQGSESTSSQTAVGLVGELGDGLEANWSRTVSVGAVNNVRDVIATGDGGVALAGITQYQSRSADPRSEAWLVKLGGEDAPRVTATAPETDAPSATATASPTPEPTATPSPTPSSTPEPTDDPTVTATATATVPETAAPNPTETTDGDGAGFGAGAALAALGGTALYERVRDED
ncbi:hypothetical protein [Halosimplex pelagicum]|uniref:PQQ-binding-like beta-propeller repeat protein n=1 Tax=Halosimplex pelagicum TaxID=869886 RepID=A0A7D5P436_9EURY|nr:hypothetical protein [Halosimplex pelagicum]QLH80423.1 hypothetical protein HZS54_01715 [Halosimplex pelagicum]